MSKIIVPLHLANLAQVPSGADAGFKKLYLRANWMKLHNGSSESDLVLDRPLDNFTPIAGTITALDTVLTALEKLQYSISSIPIPDLTLQEVTDNGNTTTNTIDIAGFTSGYTFSDGYDIGVIAGGWHSFIHPYEGLITYDDDYNSLVAPDSVTVLTNNGLNYSILSADGALVLRKNGGSIGTLSINPLTQTRSWNLPNASGTIALTSDIPSYHPIVSGNFKHQTNQLILVNDIGGEVVIDDEIVILLTSVNEVRNLINDDELIPGVTYCIKDADEGLYNGTPIYLLALEKNKLDTDGVGLFWNPKYKKEPGFGIFDPDRTYAENDVVFWGGYAWKRRPDGETGVAVDQYNLNSLYWGKISYNDDDGNTYYDKVYDKIKYNLGNDKIYYRNERNINEVSFSVNDLLLIRQKVAGTQDTTDCPIKAFQWGNYVGFSNLSNENSAIGIGNQKIINSYNQNINFRGRCQYKINLTNLSYLYNNTFRFSDVIEKIRLIGVELDSSTVVNNIFDEDVVFKNIKLQNSSLIENCNFEYSNLLNYFLNNNSSIFNCTIANSDNYNMLYDNNSEQRDTNNYDGITYYVQQNCTIKNTLVDDVISDQIGRFFLGDLPSSSSANLIGKVNNELVELPSLLGYVPTSRTITINGVGYDLSANRSWTIPTFTSPLTTKGDLFTYSTTNARLPIGLDTQMLVADSSTATGLKWVAQPAATPTGYYGAFEDNTIQTAAAINTPYAMKLGITDLNNGVTVVSDGSNLTRITIANTGVYNIQFSAQFDRTNSGTDSIDIWLRKNGVDVPGSGGKIVMTGGAVASQTIASWNYVLNVVGGDYYQLMWSTPDTHVRLLYEAAQTSPFAHPTIPSVILTVTQQSGIMAGTGLTAINSLTSEVQTLTTGTSGTDFAINSSGTTHTFNLPTASATKTGKLSSTDWSTFNGKQNALGYTPENVSNKSDSYTSSSSTTYSSTKALVDGLATKQALLGYNPYRYVNTTQTTLTGTLSETVVATSTISGNTFNSNDVMKQLFKTVKGVTLSNVTMRIRINTSNTLSGATTIATYTFATTSTIALMQRTFDLSGGNLYGFGFTSSQITDIIGISTGSSSTTYNTANTLYVFFTLQLGNNLDSCTFNMANITN